MISCFYNYIFPIWPSIFYVFLSSSQRVVLRFISRNQK